MDFQIIFETDNTLDIYPEAVEPLMNEVTLSVLVPRGKWWQSSFFGNRMAAEPRMKNTSDLPGKLRQSLLECTDWLARLNKATQREVTLQSLPSGKIRYKLKAYKSGHEVELDRFYDVSGGSI